MKISLVPYDRTFLDLSWIWLNDPKIKALTNTPDFSKAEQEKWFESLRTKTDYLIWGVKADGTPIGVCGLKNITDDDCEYWGYIGEKEYWGKGAGSIIMGFLEKEAHKLKLKSIWLKVLTNNTRAVKLYKKHGYVEEKRIMPFFYLRKRLI